MIETDLHFYHKMQTCLLCHVNTMDQLKLEKQNRNPASAVTILNEERPLLSRQARPARLSDIQRSFLSGAPDRT